MACLQANAATAQEIGDSSNRFTVVSAVRADREDQVAEGHAFMGLFHIWRSVDGWKLRYPCPNRPAVGGQTDLSTLEEIADGSGGFVNVAAYAGDGQD